MSASIDVGTVIAGRYRVEALLGKGGMGEVFSAENTRTGRRVALKVLRAETKNKEVAIERFRREARAAGAIRSEFVTEVFDVDDDPTFGIVIVFELLEGESLVERLKRTGPIDMVELWTIVEAVWAGLADAHAAGIIHRDLKPSNVFLVNRGASPSVKILDFGISKLPKQVTNDSLTQLGQSLGTFSFMPPEQIGRAKTVDHRADIYSCTTLIFQALSGKLPFSAKNAVVMMELKLKQDPLSLSSVMSTAVAPALEAFIAKGLARDPNQRFQTSLEALEAWRALRPYGALSLVQPPSSRPNRLQELLDEDSKTVAVRRRRRLPERTINMSAEVVDGVKGAEPVSVSGDEASTARHFGGSKPSAAAPLDGQDFLGPPNGALSRVTGSIPPPASVAPSSEGESEAREPWPPGSISSPRHQTIKLVAAAIGLIAVGFILAALALSAGR